MQTILFNALAIVFSPMGLVINTFGVVLGILFGAMPGLNGVVGVALLLPLTYKLRPELGLMMLGGIYMGASYGGSISAILLNCPGTGEAACTALNGNPMAKQGKAREALSYAIIASWFGGVFGVVAMILFTPALSKMALKFGPPELFLVCIAGLAVVGSMMGKSIAKGFFSIAFGLLLSIVGMDKISCNYRFTFNNMYLQSGLSLIPISVGLFAISEMLNLLTQQKDSQLITEPTGAFHARYSFQEVFHRKRILLQSAIIGTIIGVLPGTGGAIASFIAYGEAKRVSKQHELFGKGAIDGIIAPECANNAAVGGSFVPLLSLGIPGSSTSAVISGALAIQGIIPGPRLIIDHANVVYSLMFGLLVSTMIMLAMGIYGIKGFTKILKVKTKYIIPAVLVFSLIGAYSSRNSIFDILVTIVFGFIGLLFKRNQIPVAPTVLGFILGSMTEQNLRQSITIAAAKGIPIVKFIIFRPISLVVLLLIVLLFWGNIKMIRMDKGE